MSEHVVVTTANRVTTIALARPEKKNAITLQMYADITAALTAANADASVRAIVIEGGPGCFTAGNDVADFARAATAGGPGGNAQSAMSFLGALATLDKPLIAAVTGVAIGVGVTLLLHCDLVYAAPAARFKTPFVDLALVPEAASSLLLPRLVGARRAAQLLLLGEQIDAATAAAWGLINAVVEDPRAAAAAAAATLATRPPGAVRATKALLGRPDREAVLETMRAELEVFAERARSPEAMEAFQAFLMRRPADFSKF
jgi:enoyl-CoA hydratase/carnithine racemase